MAGELDPYEVAARLGCRLLATADSVLGYTLPSRAIQRRMGAGVFACEGVGISITSIQPGEYRHNCPMEPRYAIEATIARPCAVEFNNDGQTVNPIADRVAREMSADADIIWAAFNQYQPLINFQITGGLGLTTGTFQLSGIFGLDSCQT